MESLVGVEPTNNCFADSSPADEGQRHNIKVCIYFVRHTAPFQFILGKGVLYNNSLTYLNLACSSLLFVNTIFLIGGTLEYPQLFIQIEKFFYHTPNWNSFMNRAYATTFASSLNAFCVTAD